jgi:hypothetical protein
MKIFKHSISHWAYKEGQLELAFPGGRLSLAMEHSFVPDPDQPIEIKIFIPEKEHAG